MRSKYGTIVYEAETEKRQASSRLPVLALLALTLGYAAIPSRREQQPAFSSSGNTTTATPYLVPFQRYCAENVCLKASNGYERRLGRAIANGLYDGIILELFQETAIEVETDDDSVVCKSVAFTDEDESLSVDIDDTCTIGITATSIGTFTMTVVVGSIGSDASTRIVEFEMVAKYVRREIRDLDDADRNRYIDAIAVTHSVPTEVGLRKYGEQYRSTNWFTQLHIRAGADRTCDHWHGGSGFMNQHTAFTLRFEKSLQSIDPRTCVHYWDYTIDVAAGVECCWAESIMFSPNFFSTVKPNNSHHIVDTGRWAYTRIQKVGPNSSTNAYGLLAVPWNTDPTPFITRSQEIYGMANYINIPYFGCGRARHLYKTTDGFLSTANGIDKFHSQVHGMAGGYWNYLDSLIDTQDEMNAWFYNTSSAFNAMSRILYNFGLVDCPRFCSAETPAVNCSCGAATARVEANYPNASSWEILNSTGTIGKMKMLSAGSIDTSDTDSPIWDIAYEQLCNAGHIGTIVTDSSPLDPLFWSIHGMQERYIQFVRYLNDTGQYSWDQTWENTATGTWEWSEVTSETQIPVYNASDLCTGHGGDDLLIYPYLLENQATEFLTNIEFYTATKAFSQNLTYVYDQLLNWTQCGWMLGEADEDSNEREFGDSRETKWMT